MLCMKTELTLENKMKFFAQYQGQKVLALNMNKNYPIQTPWFDFVCDSHYNQPTYLELKDLSSITDEDAFVIYKLNKFRAFNGPRTAPGSGITNWLVSAYFLSNPVKCNFNLETYDYLRSKGYALTWMGLSVDEMVEAEWIKINNL